MLLHTWFRRDTPTSTPVQRERVERKKHGRNKARVLVFRYFFPLMFLLFWFHDGWETKRASVIRHRVAKSTVNHFVWTENKCWVTFLHFVFLCQLTWIFLFSSLFFFWAMKQERGLLVECVCVWIAPLVNIAQWKCSKWRTWFDWSKSSMWKMKRVSWKRSIIRSLSICKLSRQCQASIERPFNCDTLIFFSEFGTPKMTHVCTCYSSMLSAVNCLHIYETLDVLAIQQVSKLISTDR